MLQYLVILLDDTSVAFCHADNPLRNRRLIALEELRNGILFALKENLMIQFVYPDYELPEEYDRLIGSVDHVKITPSGFRPSGIADSDSWVEVATGIPDQIDAGNLVLRIPFQRALQLKDKIAKLFSPHFRLNICFTDVSVFTDEMTDIYMQLLEEWGTVLLRSLPPGKMPQVNLLTDRLVLQEMRNCDAGVKTISLAPDGRFYLCPAFYYEGVSNDEDYSLGTVNERPVIKNAHLLQIDHCPLCRKCDAYQCRRCVWLNQKLTWDINTPSRQQCVMSHIERNASRGLLEEMHKNGYLKDCKIGVINYLDPFDVREQ